MREYMSESELAYFAGIVDGEGCIGINLKKGTRNGYRITFQVTNNSKGLIDWVCERFGGKVRLVHHATYAVEWFSQGEVYDILTAIRRFLIVKQKEADIMLDYICTDSHDSYTRSMQQEVISSFKKKNGKVMIHA